MGKLRTLTRGAIANSLAAAGGVSLVASAWTWGTFVGLAATGVALVAAGWLVDE